MSGQQAYGDTQRAAPLGIATLAQGAENLLDYASVTAGENVLVLAEFDVDPVVLQAIAFGAASRRAIPYVLSMAPLPPGGAGDPSLDPVVAAWKASDVVLSCVWWADVHTKPLFFTEIRKFSTRLVAIHQAATSAVFSSAARFPPELFYAIKNAVLERVLDSEQIDVRTERGTNLVFRDNVFDTDNGPIEEPGAWSPFPYGGVNWYPGGTTGIAVIEESTVTGVPRDRLELRFEDNGVASISGAQSKDLENFSPAGFYMRHAFIGLNPKVRWHEGSQFEREKRAGAFYFGIDALTAEDRLGPGFSHCDCQFDVCDIEVDGQVLVDHGRLIVLDDPTIRSEASRFGDPDRLLATNPRL